MYFGLLLAYFVGFKWDLTPISGYSDAVDPETACGGNGHPSPAAVGDAWPRLRRRLHLPGLGQLTVEALALFDLHVVYGALLPTVLVVIALNLLFAFSPSLRDGAVRLPGQGGEAVEPPAGGADAATTHPTAPSATGITTLFFSDGGRRT